MALDPESLGPLGFGAAPIGNLYAAMPDEQAAATVRAAVDAGIRYLDTAPHYGFGLSEKRLGVNLAALDPEGALILSSKVGRRLDSVPGADLAAPRQGFVSQEPYESRFDYSHASVMRSWEDSRRRLGRDRIDILYAHDIGRFTHGDAHPAVFRQFMEGGYRALRELRDGGAVTAVGLGVNEWEVCVEALNQGDFDLILLAGCYTLLDQSPLDHLLPLCASRQVHLVIGGPFNSGILATGTKGQGPFHYQYRPAPPDIITRVAAIEAICDSHHVPLAAAALQFPLAHPQVASVIPGMNSPYQVDRAASLIRHPIPADFWAELRQAGLIRADAPVPISL